MRNRSFPIALLASLFLPSLVLAQTRGFAIDRFDASERGSDWFVGDSLDLRGTVRPAVGFVLEEAHRPLVLYSDQDRNRVRGVLVNDQLYVHLGASLVLANRLRLAANFPLALVTQGERIPYLDTTLAAVSGVAAGDLRFGVDVRLLGEYGDIATLVLGAQVYVPTGQRTSFTGDGAVRVAPHLSLAGGASLFAYSARVAFNYRAQDAQLVGIPNGAELLFVATAGLSLADHSVLIGPEFSGSTVVVHDAAFKQATTPMELLFGAHYRPKDFRFGLGVGPGLTRGIGSPEIRAVAMFEWSPSIVTDRDGDGIPDKEDACPDVPGVASPDPAKNGCPKPPDRDGDGIIDVEDACPDVPGVASDDPNQNGCPKPPDRDGDGIIDREDDCPDVPGVPSELPGRNGCPPDSDGDSIIDPEDACPTVPGPADPDPTKNGCPIARVEKDQIVITERVEFETGSAKLLESSTGILVAVMNVLAEHTEIDQVLVEGHTDNVGGAAYNKKLSEQRAKSVVKWLTSHGVDGSRLLDAGFGLERPLDSNDNAEGRQRNRRVEFHILESDGKRVGSQ